MFKILFVFYCSDSIFHRNSDFFIFGNKLPSSSCIKYCVQKFMYTFFINVFLLIFFYKIIFCGFHTLHAGKMYDVCQPTHPFYHQKRQYLDFMYLCGIEQRISNFTVYLFATIDGLRQIHELALC